MTAKLFPSLSYDRVAEVNLDLAAREYFAGTKNTVENPLNRADECQRMIDRLHEGLGADWSFGSYLEVRSTFLRGTYLDQSGNYLHLGIDCNVSAGTPVAAPFECTVTDVYDDCDYFHGWGPRIIVEPVDGSCDSYVLLAHLMPLTNRIGERISKGAIFSEIAPPPNNGNWFPHLHVQLLSRETYRLLQSSSFDDLDGYGHPSEIESLRREFPDPSWLIRGHLLDSRT